VLHEPVRMHSCAWDLIPPAKIARVVSLFVFVVIVVRCVMCPDPFTAQEEEMMLREEGAGDGGGAEHSCVVLLFCT